jgi:hypothetical protein
MRVRVYRTIQGRWGLFSYVRPGKFSWYCHADYVTLSDCVWPVSESGRQEALDTGKTTLHACVEGELESTDPVTLPESDVVQAVYRPRTMKSFQHGDGRCFSKSRRAYLVDGSRAFAEAPE